jgi:hypothetical protein
MIQVGELKEELKVREGSSALYSQKESRYYCGDEALSVWP